MKKNPLMYLFGKTWRYSEGNRKSVVGYWLAFIIGNAISLVCYPLTIAKIVNLIQKQGITEENIKYLCGLLLLIPILNTIFWLFHGPGRYVESLNGFKCRANYRKFLMQGVLTLPMQWHADHHSGDTIDKLEKGTQALYAFSSDSFLIIKNIVQLVVCYGMLAWFSPSSGIIVLLMIVLTTWITMKFDKKIIKNLKIINGLENEVTASIFDHISNIVTVVTLRLENHVLEKVSKKIDQPYSIDRRNRINIEIKWFLVSSCGAVMTAITLAAYFWSNLTTHQVILMGNVFLLIQYLDKVTDTFYDFTNIYGDVITQNAKIHNSELLSTDFRERSLQNHVLPKDWREIDVRNLDFSYHNEKGVELHLNDISLRIKRGEKIAFVGISGGGKSTVFKLFAGLYEPIGVNVSVDGETIKEGFAGICRDIALVPQAPEIFTGTIRENITMGVEVSDELIRKYTDMGCFTEVIEKLPLGLESKINEKGVNLSVGQQQRLALTRGLFVCRDKSIIILDEPTSSLDAITERRIYQNIIEESKGVALISSIHRLNMLPLFDRVYMFHDSRVVASGTLDELLESSVEFKRLYNSYKAVSELEN